MAPSHHFELHTFKIKEEESLTHGSSHSVRQPWDNDGRPPRVRRFLDSFRRDESLNFLPSDGQLRRVETAASRRRYGAPYYDLHLAALETANTPLARRLKGRHLQMIAIGGSIGTGLFVGSSKALNLGGPASLLIAYSIIGIMLYCTCQALGELAVLFPIAGSFASWSTRFLDPSWGFAMGWK